MGVKMPLCLYSLRNIKPKTKLKILSNIYDREGYTILSLNDEMAIGFFCFLQAGDDNKSIDTSMALPERESLKAWSEYESRPCYLDHVYRFDEETEEWIHVEYKGEKR